MFNANMQMQSSPHFAQNQQIPARSISHQPPNGMNKQFTSKQVFQINGNYRSVTPLDTSQISSTTYSSPECTSENNFNGSL